MTTYNIDFRSADPVEHGLSNLFPRAFVFEGVICHSMEGLVQAIKCNNIKKQKEICKFSGFKAKVVGKEFDWTEDQQLYWQGQSIDRHSQYYYEFIRNAYRTLFTQNTDAKKLLLDTGDALLTHAVGHTNPYQTVMTAKHFCDVLMDTRRELFLENNVEFE